MADMSDYELDPVTGGFKRKKAPAPIPYENTTGTGTNITGLTKDATTPTVPAPAAPGAPATPPAPATTAQTAQGNVDVMAAAQRASLGQTTSPTMAQAGAMTQQMMSDPNFGRNWEKYKTQQLSQFDLDRQNAIRAFKEKYGDIGGSGETRENLLNAILGSNLERSQREGELDTEAYNQMKENWQKAITAGQTQAKGESDLTSEAIKNLLATREVYEGEAGRTFAAEQNAMDRVQAVLLKGMDIQGQKDLTELQAKFRKDELLTAQDFQKTEAALDRALKTAMQSNDIQAQKDIAQLQADLTAIRDKKQYEYQSMLDGADRLWQTSERMDKQTFEKNMAAIDFGYKEALQKNDIASAEKLAMARLNAEISWKSLDYQLAKADLNLKKIGLDADTLRSNYEMLLKAEEAGTAPAGSALSYMKTKLGEAGAQITVLDPQSEEAINQSIQADYRNKQKVWMTSHMGSDLVTQTPLVDAMGNPVMGADGKPVTKPSLTAKGQAEFDRFINSSVYGENGMDTEIGRQELAQKAVNDPAEYARLNSDPAVKDWAPAGYTEKLFWEGNNARFQSVPAKGDVVRINGELVMVNSEPVLDETGSDDSEWIWVRNLKSGQTYKLWARNTF